MSEGDELDLERELDRLYGLPAGEFVAARSTTAAAACVSGRRPPGRRSGAAAWPARCAWAVNQLAFRAGAEFDGLRAAGERVRAAHLAGPKEQQAAAKARQVVPRFEITESWERRRPACMITEGAAVKGLTTVRDH